MCVWRRYDHIIMMWEHDISGAMAHRRSQASFYTVSAYRISIFLRNRESDARILRLFLIETPDRLQSDKRATAPLALASVQILRAFAQSVCSGSVRNVPLQQAGSLLCGQALAPFGATPCQNLAAGCRCHARTETVAAFANQSGWLKCAFRGHDVLPPHRATLFSFFWLGACLFHAASARPDNLRGLC